jgi:hypothetical protein
LEGCDAAVGLFYQGQQLAVPDVALQLLLEQLRVIEVLNQFFEPVVPDNVEKPVSDDEPPFALEHG